MKKKDYYQILKVSPLASPAAIKRSYHKLARVYHPDKNPEDPLAAEKFKNITEAYEILSDTFKRKDFDKKMQKQKNAKTNSFSPLYSTFHSYQPFSPQTKADFKEAAPAKDKSKAPSFDIKIEISLEEAAAGSQKKLVIPSTLVKKTPLLVNIPPGVQDRQILKIATGNIKPFTREQYALIVYKPHPFFKKQGHDVLMDLPVSFSAAILGGDLEIPTLRGSVRFQLPPYTHHKTSIRLEKQGFPRSASSSKKGNMIVTIYIDIPSSLSREELLWITKLHQNPALCPAITQFNIKYKKYLKDKQGKK